MIFISNREHQEYHPLCFLNSRMLDYLTVHCFSLVLLLILSLTLPYGVAAAEDENQQSNFSKANRLLKEDQVSEAIEIYKKIPSKNANADYFFNLGNAYFRDEQYGQAILNYRKSLFINPRDSDARMNLKYARKKITDRLDYGESSNPLIRIFDIINYLSIQEFYNIFLFFMGLVLTLLIVHRAVHIALIKQLLYLMTAMMIFSAAGFLYQYSHWKSIRHGVVIKKLTPVRSGPGLHFNEALTPLHAGAEVMIEENVEGWYKIRVYINSSQGRESKMGFIAQESIGLI